jgi:hypothetical protein
MDKRVHTTAQSEDMQVLAQYQYSQVANHQQTRVPLSDRQYQTNSNRIDRIALSSRGGQPMQDQYDHDEST